MKEGHVEKWNNRTVKEKDLEQRINEAFNPKEISCYQENGVTVKVYEPR